MMTTPDDHAAPPADQATPPTEQTEPPDQALPPETESAPPDQATAPDRRRARYVLAGVALLLVVALVVSAVTWNQPAPVNPPATRPTTDVTLRARPNGVDAVIVGNDPSDWDPAVQSDYGSASTIAQVFEGLTAVDAQGMVQPALAESGASRTAVIASCSRCATGSPSPDGTPITGRGRRGQLVAPARPGQAITPGIAALRRGRRQRTTGRPGRGDAVGISADGR